MNNNVNVKFSISPTESIRMKMSETELIKFKENEKIRKKENNIFTSVFKVYFRIFLILIIFSIFIGNR